MKIAIIYKSISGNTKEIAEAIYSILNQEEMVYYGEEKKILMLNYMSLDHGQIKECAIK